MPIDYEIHLKTPELVAQRVRIDQQNLADNVKLRYDFNVCASGFSGAVIAR
jgi:hypothetical protein